jgi:hypothetical protein
MHLTNRAYNPSISARWQRDVYFLRDFPGLLATILFTSLAGILKIASTTLSVLGEMPSLSLARGFKVIFFLATIGV